MSDLIAVPRGWLVCSALVLLLNAYIWLRLATGAEVPDHSVGVISCISTSISGISAVCFAVRRAWRWAMTAQPATTTEPPPESDLVKRLRADFEQFARVYLRARNDMAHPDWLFCNRVWRLFDTVARRVEDANAAT